MALAAVLLAPTTLRPPTSYPDADTRAVAELARHALLAAPAGHGPIPLLLPAPPGDAYNVSYAVRILSEHPDDWLITTDPAVFRAVAGDRHPPLWLRDTRADQTDVPDTQRTQQVGRFQLGWPTPPLSVTVAVTQLSAGDTLDARVTGLTPGEAVSAWLTAPTDTVVPFDLQLRADAAGALSAQLPLPPDAAPGRWAVTFAGLGGNSSGALDFEIVSVLDNAP